MTQDKSSQSNATRPAGIRLLARLACLAMLLLPARDALAVRVADITRLEGQQTNVITGMGLVYGLRGTGDGGDFMPAIRPLAQMLKAFNNPTDIRELQNVQNVAVVSLVATIPPTGARRGDKLDVQVMSMGAASSLRGGRLFVSPMTPPAPDQPMIAMAEGALVIEDPATPTVAVIKGGAVMSEDVQYQYVADGRFSLIIDAPSASWEMASAIAKIINEAESTDNAVIAEAIDPARVAVKIPVAERDRVASFAARIQQLPVLIVPSEARVQINDRTGTMIITGDVQISPVVISHKGLTITTVDPRPAPTLNNPRIDQQNFVAVDTTGTGANLRDLVAALEQLKVPAEDRIIIVKELHKIGKLHANLIVEN